MNPPTNKKVEKPEAKKDTTAATPSGLAIHIIDLFGKSAPLLIVVVGFLFGLWYAYKEL